jgi:hypothetical protein
VRHSGNLVLLDFWRNIRSVMPHRIIQMHPKSWPSLLSPKIQVYCFQIGEYVIVEI